MSILVYQNIVWLDVTEVGHDSVKISKQNFKVLTDE